MVLRGEVVDLARLHLLDDSQQIRRVAHVTVIQLEVPIVDIGVLIQVIDPLRIE
jgi:hypothetical protein